jgi:apolipoprotein N-acyltransferase
LFALSEEASANGADLVIWPETAWPNRGMRRRPSDSRAIGRSARRQGVDILASSIEETEDGWYNSVSHVLRTGGFGEEYRKRRLAPFAEYLPLAPEWEQWLRQREPFSHISSFLPGEQARIFQTQNKRFAVLICFESMIPGPAADLAPEVDFLVVVTNDAPFGSEKPKEAHFRSAVLRAIQVGKPVFQAANTGVTGIVDRRGTVLSRTPPGFSGPTVQLWPSK